MHKSYSSTSISPSGGTEEKIVGGYTPITKALWSDRAERLRLSDAIAGALPPTEIISKPPHRVSVSYPFTTDSTLREQYRNAWGYIRMGRLLEDLDSLAGNVAFQHCDDGDPATRPLTLVTAAVDAIHVQGSIPIDRDMRMSGFVVWTGRSSLDIRMELTMQDEGDSAPCQQQQHPNLVALFTFVAVDPVTRKSMPINQVEPQTPAERQMFKERHAVAEARKDARALAASGHQGAPSPASASGRRWAEGLLEEAQRLVELPALAPRDALLMGWTQLENSFACHPQNRNMHGRIFGGFLMRRAYELAWSCCYLFVGTRPQFSEVDTITFQRPVDVADLVRVRARVLHAQPKPGRPSQASIHVLVVATVIKPELASSATTNTFNFIFEAPMDEIKSGLKRVLPATEEEAALLAQYYKS